MMNLFKKKEPEKKVETEESKKGEVMPEEINTINVEKEYPYIIQLQDIEGTTILRRKPFGAKRYIDGANVWLINEKVGFKEPFPVNKDDFKDYTQKEVESKIQSLTAKLNDIRKDKQGKRRKTSDELDIIQQIKLFKSYSRSHFLNGDGSYSVISLEHGGRPLYTFNRIGNFKLPMYSNVDYSLMYIPTEMDIATAGELLKLNDKENGIKDNTFKILTLGMVIILALTICGFGYLQYKSTQMPENLVDSLTLLTEQNSKLTGEVVEGYQTWGNFTEKIDFKDTDSLVQPKQKELNN